MALGDCTEARAVRQEGPRGLCGDTAPRLFAARVPLDRRRARKVDIRPVLGHAVC